MCQQGQAEILDYRRSEIDRLCSLYEAYERGEIELSDEQLQDMVAKMLVLKY